MENNKFNGTILPKQKLMEMGMNFEVYESKGMVRFKNGATMENVIKIMDFGYKMSEDDLYVFIFQIDNNDEIDLYTPLETHELHDYFEKIKLLKKQRRNRHK